MHLDIGLYGAYALNKIKILICFKKKPVTQNIRDKVLVQRLKDFKIARPANIFLFQPNPVIFDVVKTT